MLSFETKKVSHEVHLIALQEFHWTPEWMSVLSHELLHCTNSVLHSRGMVMDDSTIEAYCYLHDSLVKRCLKMLPK